MSSKQYGVRVLDGERYYESLTTDQELTMYLLLTTHYLLPGERYYEQLGWRPLSQALGRAVRRPAIV